MKQSILVGALLFAACIPCASAQQQEEKRIYFYRTFQEGPATQPSDAGGPQVGYSVRMTVSGPDANIMFMGNEFAFMGKPVTGEPYSAQSVSETVQVLADGNRIVRHSTSKVFRDGAGRTRRESDEGWLPTTPFFTSLPGPETAGAGSVTVTARESGGITSGMTTGQVANARPGKFGPQIQINDPVAGVNYLIDPETHTAQMINVAAVSNQDPTVAAAVAKAGQQMAAIGKGAVTINEGGKTVVINMQHSTAEASGAAPETESLGTQTLEGVECQGTRTTFTIPAGQIGNELPIVITSERWYSPELQIVVLSKRHDPRFGDTTYKLVDIDRSEPPVSLFQVPPDYTVVNLAEKMKAAIQAKEAPRK